MKKLLLILLCLPLIGFGQSNLKLGERVYFKNFSNAKGVDISFIEPKGWQTGNESFAVDNNNLVLSYLNTSEILMVQLYISDTPYLKMNRSQVDEILNSKEFISSFSKNQFPLAAGFSVDNTSLIDINGYPFIQILAESHNLQYQVNWMTFIDNKMINIVCVSLKDNFVSVFPFFNQIKESIILKEN